MNLPESGPTAGTEMEAERRSIQAEAQAEEADMLELFGNQIRRRPIPALQAAGFTIAEAPELGRPLDGRGPDGALARFGLDEGGRLRITWGRHVEQEAVALLAELHGVDALGDLAEGKTPPAATFSAPPEPPGPPDPGPLPDSLLRVPGFVSEVMDHCLETAPYPNVVMAFAGAISLQAFLAGRKVRDPSGIRPNIYLLGLAHSAAGKDWPRKVNVRIAYQVDLSTSIGDRFASGEGLQDALFLSPSSLFQTDEIDGMLLSMSKAKDARHEAIMTTLLTMYSSSDSVYSMRKKAGQTVPLSIDQPSLVIFGTAIPNHYYEALSERMLTNGFFARMIVLESGPRPEGQEARVIELPPRILSTARWWADFQPGTGNLETWHPVPVAVEQTEEARQALISTRKEADAEYKKAEAKSDTVGTTVWGRVNEQSRKLALLYAVSENLESPRIGLAAVEWATEFVMHQTKRRLFMAYEHCYESEFHAKCKKLLALLRDLQAKGDKDGVPYWKLHRRLPWSEREHEEVRESLVGQELIHYEERSTGGTPQRTYRLA